MKYTMKLTNRHPFPTDATGTIFSDNEDTNARYDGETSAHHNARLEAWADCMIPDDCTTLYVYMSGMKRLEQTLRHVCVRRGIKCYGLWIKRGKPKKEIENGRQPEKKDFFRGKPIAW